MNEGQRVCGNLEMLGGYIDALGHEEHESENKGRVDRGLVAKEQEREVEQHEGE